MEVELELNPSFAKPSCEAISLRTLSINICKITFFPSTQYAYIYDSIYICKLCYKDKLGQTYM